MGHRFQMSLSRWKEAYAEYQKELAEQKMPMRPGEKTIWELSNARFGGSVLTQEAVE